MFLHRDERKEEMKRALVIFLFTLLVCPVIRALSQETVFKLFKGDRLLADEYFKQRNYLDALKLYKNVSERKKTDRSIQLKIARCYFFLKAYDSAITAYDKYIANNAQLPSAELYYYAEAEAGTGDYEKAIEFYSQYLAHEPENQVTINKIWQLNNIHFLYEDSAHFKIRILPDNTEYGDLCAVPFRNGVVYMSNRKETQLIERVDATLNAPFYRLYYADAKTDTAFFGMKKLGKPDPFARELNPKFHIGPVSFYDHDKKMVFATANHTSGQKNLQLFFAEEKNGAWKLSHTFPYNSEGYSVSDPAISEDGTVLYFSSDMEGGFGGKDLYKSEFIDNQWTKPVNLGEFVNTVYDEGFPHLQQNVLYFSSNGHAGFGGLDIFKIEINEDLSDEPQNIGHPINTNHDEFGISMDSSGAHGYFSSNRRNGGYNDDIYEFTIDLQEYPLDLNGSISYKEHNWSDSSSLLPMQHARVELVDAVLNTTVGESTTDEAGDFTLVVPNFSVYKLKLMSEDNDEIFISLEMPKYRTEQSKHEIVIVKDDFKSSGKSGNQ